MQKKLFKNLELNILKDCSLEKYEKSYINITEFLSRFRTDSEEVKNMTKSDRDKLFGYGKELFADFQNKYSNLYFNFELSRKEWKYIESNIN